MNYTQSIADILNRPGSVIVMAADTVYGLMARAVDKEATERLYRLKDRSSHTRSYTAQKTKSKHTITN